MLLLFTKREHTERGLPPRWRKRFANTDERNYTLLSAWPAVNFSPAFCSSSLAMLCSNNKSSKQQARCVQLGAVSELFVWQQSSLQAYRRR